MFFHGGCKSSFVQLTCPKKDILSSAGGGISLLHQRAALLTQDGIERGGGGWGGQSRDQVALKKKRGLALFQVMVMAICETCDRGSEGCRLGGSVRVMDATLMAESARRYERRP